MYRILELTQSFMHLNMVLGEGPLWHPIEDCLYWLDIEVGILFRYHPRQQHFEKFSLGTRAGCFAFRKAGGLVIATENGLAFWDRETGLSANFVDLYPPGSANMMNDGRVDSAGRFWVGSKGPNSTSALFRLDGNRTINKVLEGVTISNGIDWSPDNRYCYYVDSGESTLYRYAFDIESAYLYSPEVFYQPKDFSNPCTPDGLCVDSAGNIWVALWDGSQVLQFSPQGELLHQIRLPVSRPTSITLGGQDLRSLYITSASTELNREELADQPLAGDLFCLRVEIPGKSANFYSG